MKKLVYGSLFLALVGILFVSCNKEDKSNDLIIHEGDELSPMMQKAQWPPSINIDITFDVIRLARAKTTENHAGRICACNECFGICNKPWDAGIAGSFIGVEQVSDSVANLYLLNELPSNFEVEFGIDEPVSLRTNSTSGAKVYNIKPKVYTAINEEGYVHCPANNRNYSYFTKVRVELE